MLEAWTGGAHGCRDSDSIRRHQCRTQFYSQEAVLKPLNELRIATKRVETRLITPGVSILYLASTSDGSDVETDTYAHS